LGTTSLSGKTTYSVRGFEERDIYDAPQYSSYHSTDSNIGTQVSGDNNATKLVATWIGLGTANYVTNTTNIPGSKNFTIVDANGDFDSTGSIIKCNDSNIYNGYDWDITIEEDA